MSVYSLSGHIYDDDDAKSAAGTEYLISQYPREVRYSQPETQSIEYGLAVYGADALDTRKSHSSASDNLPNVQPFRDPYQSYGSSSLSSDHAKHNSSYDCPDYARMASDPKHNRDGYDTRSSESPRGSGNSHVDSGYRDDPQSPYHLGEPVRPVLGYTSRSSVSSYGSAPSASSWQCRLPGCDLPSTVDPNTGEQMEYCSEVHRTYVQFLLCIS
ncbi:hypothetical protein BV25DRAFT_301361 [Artomyces pyxidatus]|uniref:Uncharacterized protein n=1 Tax=Artomyces pyxidatus TaxID=48021 RepID=A0ACB8T806_9AGAM|nr:hypothetical protein BV25DRAFT_301361 [Artomyces pyxidatus]